jgi:flagellar hook protein FlgE
MSDNMMYTAIAGLNTFNEALSVVADNIANANTTGFKSNTVDFGDLVSGLIATSNNNTVAQGVGSTILGVTADFTTGSEIQTGTWSDLMIQGNGFFAVKDSGGATYYTRDGSFSINSSGVLSDANGNEVLDDTGAPITVANPSSYVSFAVDKYGNLTGTDSTGTVTTLGTIGVTTFSNPNGLIRDGNNYYTPGANAGIQSSPFSADTGQAGQIISGALEDSNVDLTAQMVNLIDYQADYQANSKSITTDNEMIQTITNLIR